MIGVLNDGCTALMTSIGHQAGLFGTLATTGSATSAQVAEVSGLNERYVREWLNAMTTARFGGTTRSRAPTPCRASTPRGWSTTLGQITLPGL